ncbi:DUF6428 family protein [Neisseria sp. S1]|uniref:DUF6428 family protein n=1 Tax=Neisseria sp. S1 TaxID=3318354 RepID=UPI003A881EA7
MKLSKFKQHLHNLNALTFILPCGSAVPAHFHITEVAKNDKHFIDCGGIIRHETRIGFQLWVAHDTEHRLSPAKLLSIIRLSERKLDLPDAEIEVEYQYQTIGKYRLSFSDGIFRLENTLTACLAPDQCGIPQQKPRIRLGNSLCKK